MNESSSPFLGRWREVGHLERRLGFARAGEGGVVVVAGEAGIGKTRLAREFADRAAAAGALAVWGRSCEIEVGAPAFAPWLELLSSLLREAGGQIGAQTLREMFSGFRRTSTGDISDGAPLEDEPSQDLRFHLFERIVDLIRAAGTVSPEPGAPDDSVRPVLIVIDDVQWADSASLLLLRYVARMCHALPLLLVVTYDSEAPKRSAQLADTLISVEREPGASRLDLAGLTESDVQELTSLVLGTRDARVVRLAERVHRQTGGNPFSVQEVLRMVRAAGPWTDSADEVPATVRDVVEGRLTRLSDIAQQVLRVASVLGSEFDAEVLERVAQVVGRDLDGALDEAERANFIEPSESVRHYRFVHAITRGAVYAGFTSRSRTRVHRAVAEVLEVEYGAGVVLHAGELAHHFGEVGDTERALRYRLEAGEQARAATAWEEAACHYQVAAGLLGLEEDRRHEAEVLFSLGRCWRLAGAPRSAWQALMRALSAFEELGEGVWAARAALEALRIPASSAHRESLARRGLVALGTADEGLEARLHLSLALWSRDRVESRRRARQIAEAEGLVDVIAALEQERVNQALCDGQPSEARAELERLHRLCLDHGRRGWALRFLTSASSIPVFAGDLDEGESALLRVIAFSDGASPLWEGGLLTWLAGIALARGDAARYRGLLERSRHVHPDSFRLTSLLALQHEVLGELEAALELLPGPEQAGKYPGWLAIVHGTRARVLFEAGQRDAAVDELERWAQHWTPFRTADGSPGYLHALSCVDSVMAQVGPERLVREVDRELGQWAWARFAPGNACSLDRMRGDLALRLGRLDEAERWYRGGAEWALRERCDVEVGRCEIALADLAVLGSDPAGALDHIDRAIRFLRKAGAALYLRHAVHRRERITEGWTSEPEVEARTQPAGMVSLSPRELEVLRLIADGHTNRQIADLLTISPNTVARHVTHIFNKTGVANRAEAVSYAHRQQLLGRR